MLKTRNYALGTAFSREEEGGILVTASVPGESQRWGSLGGCRLWGRTESDTTEVT